MGLCSFELLHLQLYLSSGDDLPRIRHRCDRRCVIFVVLLVISSDGGSCGDVGRKFFVMTSNVGMTAKLIP